MIAIVCGGRDYGVATGDRPIDREIARAQFMHVGHELWVLLRELSIERIREGDAPGADRSAAWWAQALGVPVDTFPADWRGRGKRAGIERNALMLSTRPRPGVVIAFAGGRGTADMVLRGAEAGVQTIQIPRASLPRSVERGRTVVVRFGAGIVAEWDPSAECTAADIRRELDPEFAKVAPAWSPSVEIRERFALQAIAAARSEVERG